MFGPDKSKRSLRSPLASRKTELGKATFEEEEAPAVPSNVMFNRRIARGSYWAGSQDAQGVPAPEQATKTRSRVSKARSVHKAPATSNRTWRVPVSRTERNSSSPSTNTPRPVSGRQHIDIQTEDVLEPLPAPSFRNAGLVQPDANLLSSSLLNAQREEAQRLEKDIAYLQAEKRELISATAAEAAELHRLKVEVMAAGEAIASHRTFSLQGLSPVPRASSENTGLIPAEEMHPEKVAHFSKEADEEQESSKKDDSSNFSDTSYDGYTDNPAKAPDREASAITVEPSSPSLLANENHYDGLPRDDGEASGSLLWGLSAVDQIHAMLGNPALLKTLSAEEREAVDNFEADIMTPEGSESDADLREQANTLPGSSASHEGSKAQSNIPQIGIDQVSDHSTVELEQPSGRQDESSPLGNLWLSENQKSPVGKQEQPDVAYEQLYADGQAEEADPSARSVDSLLELTQPVRFTEAANSTSDAALGNDIAAEAEGNDHAAKATLGEVLKEAAGAQETGSAASSMEGSNSVSRRGSLSPASSQQAGIRLVAESAAGDPSLVSESPPKDLLSRPGTEQEGVSEAAAAHSDVTAFSENVENTEEGVLQSPSSQTAGLKAWTAQESAPNVAKMAQTPEEESQKEENDRPSLATSEAQAKGSQAGLEPLQVQIESPAGEFAESKADHINQDDWQPEQQEGGEQADSTSQEESPVLSVGSESWKRAAHAAPQPEGGTAAVAENSSDATPEPQGPSSQPRPNPVASVGLPSSPSGSTQSEQMHPNWQPEKTSNGASQSDNLAYQDIVETISQESEIEAMDGDAAPDSGVRPPPGSNGWDAEPSPINDKSPPLDHAASLSAAEMAEKQAEPSKQGECTLAATSCRLSEEYNQADKLGKQGREQDNDRDETQLETPAPIAQPAGKQFMAGDFEGITSLPNRPLEDSDASNNTASEEASTKSNSLAIDVEDAEKLSAGPSHLLEQSHLPSSESLKEPPFGMLQRTFSDSSEQQVTRSGEEDASGGHDFSMRDPVTGEGNNGDKSKDGGVQDTSEHEVDLGEEDWQEEDRASGMEDSTTGVELEYEEDVGSEAAQGESSEDEEKDAEPEIDQLNSPEGAYEEGSQEDEEALESERGESEQPEHAQEVEGTESDEETAEPEADEDEQPGHPQEENSEYNEEGAGLQDGESFGLEQHEAATSEDNSSNHSSQSTEFEGLRATGAGEHLNDNATESDSPTGKEMGDGAQAEEHHSAEDDV